MPSAQQEAILHAVHTLDHPTADEVFLHVRHTHPRVSLGTIYRNLEALARDGRIRARDVGTQRRYDDLTDPHAHLHCTRCERLIDVPYGPAEMHMLKTGARMHGFDVDDFLIELRGVCATCRGDTGTSPTEE